MTNKSTRTDNDNHINYTMTVVIKQKKEDNVRVALKEKEN